MIRLLLRSLMLVLLCFSAAHAQAPSQSHRPASQGADVFSPRQRAAIVDILRQALQTDPSILRDAVAALQQDDGLREQAATRTAIAGAQAALVATPGDPAAGNPHGRVTLIEFFDVRCPYCRSMLPVIAELLRAEPDLRLVYKDIPILGPGSVLGARAELAAQMQGGYARMHDALMRGPAAIDMGVVQAAAVQAGLDWPRLRRDMNDPVVLARIKANLQLAQTLDVQGTPAFVVGDQMIPGAAKLADLQAAVAAARSR